MEEAAETQESFDATIVWETPDSPVTADDYVFQNGKRLVRPYFFEFIAHAKERWGMKTIVNLFAEEFRQRPRQYYVQAVDSGRILVDGKVVTIQHVVRASQTLSHFVHRHEPPVMANPVTILEVDRDVITVCKPASIPVHPCGQYRKNTVLGILQAEHNFGFLYPIHRLDRLVSGLLIFARNAHTADQFRQEIEGGGVNKVYVAKVQGVFPDEEVELNAAVSYDAKEGRSTAEENVDLPQKAGNEIDSEGGKLSQNKSLRNVTRLHIGRGKQACTRFRRLATDGVHSIVECVPLTGRTHQIRVHLQYLGHPIANDALYAVDNPPSRSEKGTNAERAARAEKIPTSHTLDCGAVTPNTTLTISNCKRQRISDEDIGNSEQHSSQFSILNTAPSDQSLSLKMLEGRKEGEDCNQVMRGDTNLPKNLSMVGINSKDVEFMVDPMCTHCPKLAPSGYEGDEHGLWLHCVRYSGQGWNYECPLPIWANIQTLVS